METLGQNNHLANGELSKIFGVEANFVNKPSVGISAPAPEIGGPSLG